MIEQGTGNLLRADAEALVNTVNCVGVMGKGIALQFKKAWPAMFEDYKAACKAKEVRPGHIHVWPTERLVGPRYIFNFPTKRHWRAKSRLEDIDEGLSALRQTILDLGLSSVAIPPLGAGNGGLDWGVVRPRIEAALGDLDGVTILLWDPGHAPAPADRPVRTERPKWTPARATMVALMGQYRAFQGDLTQLEAQKLAYLVQVSGYPSLKLRFRAHHYGPYADQLYHLLQALEGHQIRGLVDRKPDARLIVADEAYQQARERLEDTARPHFERVSRLIEGFEDPYGMELLATVHWVATHDESARTREDAALEGVRNWSEMKRSKMRPSHVRLAWQRLHEQGWLFDLAV